MRGMLIYQSWLFSLKVSVFQPFRCSGTLHKCDDLSPKIHENS